MTPNQPIYLSATSTFGQTTSLFGGSPTPGEFQQPPKLHKLKKLISPISAPAFGAAPSTGLFGQPQQQQPQQQLQQQQTGSTVAPYSATPKQDGNNSITLHSITSMPQYEAKSFEELRLEDYLNNNKGTKGQNPPATGFGGFGAPGKSAGMSVCQSLGLALSICSTCIRTARTCPSEWRSFRKRSR